MFGDLFNTVVRMVNSWKPEKRYRKEEGYRNDLLKFLRKSLKKGLNRSEFFGLGPKKRVKIVKESGRALCDIGVGGEVGIELKRNLRRLSQVDRLWGQLKRFLPEYSDLIVVLVGKTDTEAYEVLSNHVNKMSSSATIFQAPKKRIKVVNKEERKVRKREKKEKARKGKRREKDFLFPPLSDL